MKKFSDNKTEIIVAVSSIIIVALFEVPIKYKYYLSEISISAGIYFLLLFLINSIAMPRKKKENKKILFCLLRRFVFREI